MTLVKKHHNPKKKKTNLQNPLIDPSKFKMLNGKLIKANGPSGKS